MNGFYINSVCGFSNSGNNNGIKKETFLAKKNDISFIPSFEINNNCAVYINGILQNSGYSINNNSVIFEYQMEGGEIITVIN